MAKWKKRKSKTGASGVCIGIGIAIILWAGVYREIPVERKMKMKFFPIAARLPASIGALCCLLLASWSAADAAGPSWIAELSDIKAHEAKANAIEIRTPVETFITVGVYETEALNAQAPPALAMDVYRIRHVGGEGSAGPIPRFLAPPELPDLPDFEAQTSWALRLYCRKQGIYRVYIEGDGARSTVKVIVSEPVEKSNCGFGFYVDQNQHMYSENLPVQLDQMCEYGCNTLAFQPAGETGEESLRVTAKMLDHGVEIGLFDKDISVLIAGGMDGIRQFGKYPDKWPQLIMHLRDEPKRDDMARVYETRKQADALGVRLGAAISPAIAFPYGNLLNAWIVSAEHQSRLLRDKARRDGAEWWVYTGGLRASNAALSRYYSGLWTWKHRPRGNLARMYMDNKSSGVLADGGWRLQEADGKINTSAWALASPKGPIATVGLTGFRDGTVDYRILCELERLIDQITRGDNESRLPAEIYRDQLPKSVNFLGRLRDDVPSRFETSNSDLAEALPPLDCVEVRRRALAFIEEFKPWE